MKMNVNKVLYIYKWATMGGVERVLLNRAHAFQSNELLIRQDVYFLQDGGGLNNFRKYIEKNALMEYIGIIDAINPDAYDVILSIDTPEIFDLVKEHNKIYIECHTSYKNNRTYLKTVPDQIGGILVPSSSFKDTVVTEVTSILKPKVYLLRNCVPSRLSEQISVLENRFLGKTPIFYMGRMDKHKNTEELIDIFAKALNQLGDRFILVLAGNVMQDIDLWKLVHSRKIVNRLVYLPPVRFHKVSMLMALIKSNGGIFISTSKGESFGLSAAEAISFNLPVLLSDIPAHRELVNNDDTFLYALGNTDEAVAKLKGILDKYSLAVDRMKEFRKIFSNDSFIKDWKQIFSEH
ncbi:group 1 glycosyl transferase [Collibacillus ludicampi]|uniref:Group 1 glycosyl transferase n=1 Tax=Collibacillus ludicampi TaxID=2771369 RepID=A0AAV4LDC6_9BACL|nr:glycosyltransferase family 4 protein [Collibacillus ludicampi]GIM45663.1 group 1 glycosyl transferase [Collibacillus ludicampi]